MMPLRHVPPRPAIESASREAGALIDPFGRPVDDLRVSVTPACDLACWFCHHEGTRNGAREMSAWELRAIVRIASRLGIRYLKLTGGEPLLRPDLVDVVRHTTPLFEEVSLVTNGQRLESVAGALHSAGLRRVNVSLHTLDAGEYRKLTGAPVEPVLRGIRAAVNAGLFPVKANVVVTPRTPMDLDRLLSWAAAERVALQFIELHTPPGTASRVESERVPLGALEEELVSRAGAVTTHRLHGRRRYHLDGVSVDVTRPQGNASFCASCTRLRLTHDGRLRPCLMRTGNEVDLLGPLRRGASEQDLEQAFRRAASNRAPYWRSLP